MSTAKLGLRPYTVTRKEAKTLLPPSYVERLIYAANNFPELGWLEILPGTPGRKRRETHIVLESLDQAFRRIRSGEIPPELPWLAKATPKTKRNKKPAWNKLDPGIRSSIDR
jgi:hypothetical protein